MSIPDVRIVPSEDHLCKKEYNPLDPTGFLRAGLTQTEIQDLCDLATEEYRRVLGQEHVPAVFMDYAPKTMPLFYNASTLGVAYNKASPTSIKEKSPGAADPERFIPLNTIRGIGVRVGPGQLRNSENLDSLRRSIGHECIHVITHPKVSTLMRGPNEAMTMAIERTIYENHDDELMNKKLWEWTRENTRSTDGLCPPDFADISFAKNAIAALYLSASTAFENETPEQLWNAAGMLTERALNTGSFPIRKDIDHTIRTVFPQTAEKILRSPAFREMSKEGRQIMWTRNAANTHAIFFSVMQQRMEQNIPESQYYTFCATEHDEKIPYTTNFFDKQGKKMKYTESGDLEIGKLYNMEGSRSLLNKAGANGMNIANSIGKKQMIILGINKPVEILDTKQQKAVA